MEEIKSLWRPTTLEIFTLLWFTGSAILLLRMAAAGIRLRSLARMAKQPAQRIQSLFDMIREENKKLIATLEENGIEHEWHLTEGGHSWPIWRHYCSDRKPSS